MTALLIVAGALSLEAQKIGGTRIEKGNDLAGVITDSSSGKGIPGVAVSDGYNYTVTDRNGVYQMKAHPRSRTVSYTTPSGYEIALDERHSPAFYAFHTPGEAFSRHDFTLTPLNRSEDDFVLVVLADPQCHFNREFERFKSESMPDLRTYVNRKIADGTFRNVYAITLGDVIYDGQDGWLPIFQVIGNHDHYNAYYDDWGATSDFVRYFGPTDYSFDRGDVHFVVMDNVYYLAHGTVPEKGFTKVKYTGGFTPEQVEWLRQDLALVAGKDGKAVVLCTHIPLMDSDSDVPGELGYNYGKVLSLLTPFKEARLLIGHTHYPQTYYHDGRITAGGTPISEHIHGAVCGAWWHCNSCVDGTPMGYVWYRFKGPSVYDTRAKFTFRDDTLQLRVYDGNAIYTGAEGYVFEWEKELKDCFVATVWYDDDRNWSVRLEMDGKTYPMKRVTRPQRDWYSYSFFLNEKKRNPRNVSYQSDRLHFWTVSVPGVRPSEASGWKIVARQSIPSSGLVHEYTASKIESGYEDL